MEPIKGTNAMNMLRDVTLDITHSTEINADREKVFTALVERLGKANQTLDGTPMPMVLELWPGGRWFRDLGDQQGHLWGFVQVIKPPALLEIVGPMFMSYAVAGHVQARVHATENQTTELTIRHQAFGLIQETHRREAVHGWKSLLDGVQQLAETGS